MDYRSINKLFLFNSVLKKYNKRNDIELSISNLFILYAIYYQSKTCRCTISELDKLLRKNKHTNSRNNLFKQLKTFEIAGWVKLESNNPKRFRITVDGLNVLNDIERKIRVERINLDKL